MKNKLKISTNKIHKAVSQSSKMEGLSFNQAKKNKQLIKILKSYDRAFSVSS